MLLFTFFLCTIFALIIKLQSDSSNSLIKTSSSLRQRALEEYPRLLHDDLVYDHRRNTVPIVNEEYKLIFFLSAKVASSQWVRFLMRANADEMWCSNETTLHNPQFNGLKYLSDYTLEEAQKMMVSKEWTRAVFVRHPKPRLLSAFIDKAIDHNETFIEKYCPHYANRLHSTDEDDHDPDVEYCIEHHLEFDFFLYNITRVMHDNVHFRSLYSTIDEKWWPSINFIGHMHTLSEDTEKLLQSLFSRKNGKTLWENFGKSGWGDTRDCENIGTDAFLAKRENHHETDAKDKLKDYYTPELELYVENHFADDLNNPYFHIRPMSIFPKSNLEE